ncbi:MAG TPA: integrase [Bacteroidetes bacterium]|nr:integrase [Bacteroidota bacterium]
MQQDRFFQYLQYEKRYSPHTLTAYRTDLGQFVAYLNDIYQIKKPSEVAPVHIRSWIVDLLGKKNSTRSINRKLSCLKTYFKFLRKHGEIKQNPMSKVTAPKMGKRLPVFVNENNMELLFDSVDFGEGFSGLRNRLIMELLYCTGIRRSELISLRLEDVDFANYRIKVLGKGNKERLIPIARHLVLLIERYLDQRQRLMAGKEAHPWLLVTDKGKMLYPGLVYKLAKKYLSAVTTLEQRSPHVLRHTFATHLSNNGADLNAIKELLGHSSLAATQIYMHNSIEKLRKVYTQAHPKAKPPSGS